MGLDWNHGLALYFWSISIQPTCVLWTLWEKSCGFIVGILGVMAVATCHEVLGLSQLQPRSGEYPVWRPQNSTSNLPIYRKLWIASSPFILWEHVADWTNKESQVLFTSDCKMECEIDRWIGAVCSWSTAQYISRGRSLDIRRELKPLLLHTECHLIGMLFKTYPSGGISGMSNWKETTEQTQITLVIIWCGNMLGSPRITCCQSNVSGCMNI